MLHWIHIFFFQVFLWCNFIVVHSPKINRSRWLHDLKRSILITWNFIAWNSRMNVNNHCMLFTTVLRNTSKIYRQECFDKLFRSQICWVPIFDELKGGSDPDLFWEEKNTFFSSLLHWLMKEGRISCEMTISTGNKIWFYLWNVWATNSKSNFVNPWTQAPLCTSII